jgi:hypothetical protein
MSATLQGSTLAINHKRILTAGEMHETAFGIDETIVCAPFHNEVRSVSLDRGDSLTMLSVHPVQPGVSICDLLTGRQTQSVPCETADSAIDRREINFLAFSFLREISWLSGASKSNLTAWFTYPTMRGADMSAHQSPQCNDVRVALRTTEMNSAQSNCLEKVPTCAFDHCISYDTSTDW